MQVEGWLSRAARVRPGWPALETPEGSLTYAELQTSARAGARALERAGVHAGDRVAIVQPPGLQFARSFHACLLLGAVAVPVDVRLGERDRALLCAGTSVVVAEPLPGDEGRAELAGERSHDLDRIAAVIHTSGTSAAPRPVELTYGNFLWSALGSAVALDRDPGERWLCALPVAHVGGLSILVRSCIYATTALIHPRFELDSVLYALQRGEVTLVSLVATTLTRLLDAGLHEPRTLRCALTGGGPVAPALIARAREAGVPVAATYGLTEACSQVTTAPVARLRGPMRETSAHGGVPLFCTRVRIAADEEILVAGPTVAPGALAGDGWLHTGDLGALEPSGELRVSGRKADTIVSGGENIAPAEVEAVLESHPGVLEAAVVARADERWGEAVAAVVVARPGESVDAELLRAHCAQRLAPFKVPKRVELVGGPLPRTRSGKLLRRELR